MGIFADVGPLTCFISTHVRSPLPSFPRNPDLTCSWRQLIPADFTFDPNANPPCFASNEDTVRPPSLPILSFLFLISSSVPSTAQLKIEKGTKIRLKIVGTRVDATEIVSPPSLLSLSPL